ncbi:hypothetical protein M378DRAFT_18167, partial [Amanita muscaria Koide BX008]
SLTNSFKAKETYTRKDNKKQVVKDYNPQEHPQDKSALPPHKAARSNLQVVLHRLSYKEKQLYQRSWPVPRSPQIIQQFPEHLHRHNRHPKTPSHNTKEKHNPFRDPLINKEIKEQKEEDHLTTDQNPKTK